MPVRNLDRILRPRRVAVVGAGADPRGVGATVLRNLLAGGFQGTVYPVNRARESVQGVHAYPSVGALPQPVDLAILCTPAESVPGIVRECGEAGTPGVVVVSAGFRETGGGAGAALERALAAELARFPGMRLLGPNCLGVVVPSHRMNASFQSAMPRPGRVAFLSQSGALGAAILDWAVGEGIGVSCFVSLGNMLDVGFAALIDRLAADRATESLILYVESIPESREFLSAARAFARTKPIVAFKAGRFPASAKAAASHTGALAGEDAVYDAAFARAGIVRAHEIDELFDCAELLARSRRPRGARLAIVTNAGGPGVMAADALLARGGTLAELEPSTVAALGDALPPHASRANPVDVLGDAPPDRFGVAARAVLEDPGVDALLALLTPQAMTDPLGTAHAVAAAAGASQKPVLASFLGGASVAEGTRALDAANVPCYATPEKAVRAFLHLVAHARGLALLHETPRELPLGAPPDLARARAILAGARGLLDEAVSKELLECHGIATTRAAVARDPAAAVAAARAVGYPVVVKILSRDIPHKTDAGGVALDLHSDGEVEAAFARVVGNARRLRPEARVEGVTVQRMVALRDGFELILGARRDPVFGSVVLVGAGGIAAEVSRDTVLGLPPLNERLARRMLESLRLWPLLRGYRGRPGVDLDALLRTLVRFSHLVAAHGEIAETDVNPLWAGPKEVVAVDARVLVEAIAGKGAGRPFGHLAIRPYPDEYAKPARLADGTFVLVRPIRPEDEPMWVELLAACSDESILHRFRVLFRRTTHEMAARYCYVDYDREMDLVAEVEVDGRRRLFGACRLVADPDREEAEYAVLVGDPWQRRGLGSLLTDRILEVARDWGVRRVRAETTPDNAGMVALFRRKGFALERGDEGRAVLATLETPGRA